MQRFSACADEKTNLKLRIASLLAHHHFSIPMLTVSLQGAKFSGLSGKGSGHHYEVRRTANSASWTMSTDLKSASVKEIEDLTLQIPVPPAPRFNGQKSSSLQFNRLKPLKKYLMRHERHKFGQFVAREALLDEEYWTAAWLRAESHWEDRPNERYVENCKRKFAEQEFSAIKRRCIGLNGQKCTCIVMVSQFTKSNLVIWKGYMKGHPKVRKDQGNEKCTVLKSVVGTLDLSIQYLLHGETFPGERLRAPLFCRMSSMGPSRYSYISNLCVAKSARRQGIASNMLNFALESAKTTGVEIVYVHVRRDNKAAQLMYEKIGFQVVDEANKQLLEEQTYLLSKEI